VSATGDPATAAKTVTVFGGSGFLGRRVVERLLDLGFSVRVATRHPQPQNRDRLTSLAADVNRDAAVAAAVEGCFGVVNAVSLYVENAGQTFDSVHVEAAGRVARQAKAAGVARLTHVSGIGADPASGSPYIASRGRGEDAVRQAFPAACLVRPAVMIGPDDAFVVPLGRLLRRVPVFALFGRGDTRLQPVHVEDVAYGIARSFVIDAPAPLYELGGPQIYSYRELLELLRSRLGARTVLLPLPFSLWHGLAAVAERLPSPPITRNQVALMRVDNVVSGRFPGFADLGVLPQRLDQALPDILHGR
jgi:NADH dehydrogenase